MQQKTGPGIKKIISKPLLSSSLWVCSFNLKIEEKIVKGNSTFSVAYHVIQAFLSSTLEDFQAKFSPKDEHVGDPKIIYQYLMLF